MVTKNFGPFFEAVPGKELIASRKSTLVSGDAAFDLKDHDKASGYQADESLAAAVNAAIVLSKPLLLMGPRTGKTELARAVAWQFDLPLYKFETKSSSQSRELFYTYDSLRAFSDRDADEIDHHKYLTFQALGRAILDAVDASDPRRQAIEGKVAGAPKPRRSVVLIDEIDKAPRDFPNDLLNEIEHLYFKVPELNRDAHSPSGKDIDPAMRPIVLITSNDERGLPAPFLRRCLFHHIEFPDVNRMKGIVAAHLKLKFDEKTPLPAGLQSLLDVFFDVRKALESQGSAPSTSEILDWIDYLKSNRVDFDISPQQMRDKLRERLGASAAILAKSREGSKKAKELIDKPLLGTPG